MNDSALVNKPPLVIKLGGSFLEQSNQQAFFNALTQVAKQRHLLLVHGGGQQATQLLTQLGFESQKLNGLRITPTSHLPIVVGALAGQVNKQLVSQALQANLNPVGLCLADGPLARCQTLADELGAVGKVVQVFPELLVSLWEQCYLPILSSIGAGANGQLLNINADEAATAVAQALNAELWLLSDVPGVLDADGQSINQLNQSSLGALLQNKVITDGMLVKVKAALQAANALGKAVTIASWQQPEQLLSTLNGLTFGTQVLPE